jgi:hypothetical protein
MNKMKNIYKNNKAVADVIPAMFALSAIIIAGLLITTIFSQPLQQSQVIETKDIKAMNLEISSLLLGTTGERTDSGTNWEDAVALASSVGLKVNTGEQAESIPASVASTGTGDPLYSNNPPNVPSTPFPSNGNTSADVNIALSWTGGDPDEDDIVVYDIYFGTSSNPGKVLDDATICSYKPATLSYNTPYYWKIIAYDNHDESAEGPTWSFTTSNFVNTPPVPSIPSGPTTGYHKVSYTYSTSATDDDGHNVKYGFDWGDGSDITWTSFVSSGTSASASHTWSKPGTYSVKAEAQDSLGATSDFSSSLQVVIQSRAPNKPLTPTYTEQVVTGPKLPKTLVDDYFVDNPLAVDDDLGLGSNSIAYIFSTYAIDVDGDMVQYRFDWGDGTAYSGWTDLVENGATGSCVKVIDLSKSYSITAQARDEYEVTSVWSDPVALGAVPVCGDGVCNGAETCSSCPQDCGKCEDCSSAYCGYGVCNCSETCSTCSPDCGSCSDPTYCGDGKCNGAETCDSCSKDCHCPADCPCPDPCDSAYCGDGKCDCGEKSCCFPAGTLISMADGTFKPIEDVFVGEYVLSYNVDSGVFVSNAVLETMSIVRSGVYIINDGLVSPTNDHPLYTRKADGRVGWASVDPDHSELGYDFVPMKLEIGDEIFSSELGWIKIEKMEYQEGPIQTYNLKDVADESNFFANNILVHNLGSSCTCTKKCGEGPCPDCCCQGTLTGYKPNCDCACTCKKMCEKCFLSGSKIIMADGNLKNIEDLVPGDIIRSYDIQTDSFTIDEVKSVQHDKPEDMLFDYYLVINEKIKVTPDHPILIDGEWKPVGDLVLGDTIGYSTIKVESIETAFERVPTYNFETVSNRHNYLVDIDGTDFLIAHNGGTYVQGGYDEETGATQNSVSEYSSILSIKKINALKAVDYYWLKDEVFNLPENVHFEVKIQSIDGTETILSYGPSGVSSNDASIVTSNQENVVITDSSGFVYGTFQVITYQI